MTPPPDSPPAAHRNGPAATAIQLAEPRPQAASAKPPADRPDPTRYGDWEKNGRCIDF
jgi:hypothetical protein